jgi:ankyrin repeat protein
MAKELPFSGIRITEVLFNIMISDCFGKECFEAVKIGDKEVFFYRPRMPEKCSNETVVKIALFQAVRIGDIDSVINLLKEVEDVDDVADFYGTTILHQACIEGNAKIVNLLLSSGALPYSTDQYDNSPLHGACWYDHTEIVRILLDSQVDIDESVLSILPYHNNKSLKTVKDELDQREIRWSPLRDTWVGSVIRAIDARSLLTTRVDEAFSI